MQLFRELGTDLDNQEALRRWQADMAFLRATREAAARLAKQKPTWPTRVRCFWNWASTSQAKTPSANMAFIRTFRSFREQRVIWFVAAGIIGVFASGLLATLYAIVEAFLRWVGGSHPDFRCTDDRGCSRNVRRVIMSSSAEMLAGWAASHFPKVLPWSRPQLWETHAIIRSDPATRQAANRQ